MLRVNRGVWPVGPELLSWSRSIGSAVATFQTPSPVAPRLVKAPAARHPFASLRASSLPQRGEGKRFDDVGSFQLNGTEPWGCHRAPLACATRSCNLRRRRLSGDIANPFVMISLARATSPIEI